MIQPPARRRFGLLSWLVTAIALVGLSGAAFDAEAKGKRRAKKRSAPIKAKAAGELMGPFKFGMSKIQVLKVLARQIDAKYADKIKEATDIYSQDKLRKAKKNELNRIKQSYVEFKGKKTGWDVSIIDREFEHRTDESMMVYWENVDGKDQRRFFFFHEGRLWKMFIALNSKSLNPSQRTFEFFQQLTEARFGRGKVHYEKRRGAREKSHLAWANARVEVKAIDKLQFYGNFCLSIADRGVQSALEPMRLAKAKPKRKNGVIDAVVSKDDAEDTPSLDENKDVLDWTKKK
jgi:hypothetical protein